MPNQMEEWWNQARAWWNGLDTNRKILSGLGGVMLGAITAGAIIWSTSPDYTVLYSDLNPRDANAIVEHLRETKIPYRVSGGGAQIEVPSKHVYELRIELAGQGLPRGEGVGFEIFDKTSFGITNEVQRINYLRALQSELERTIESLEVIEKCRIHLVMPKDDLWMEESFAPTASVMVKLATGGSMLPRQVQSIRHLLASGVRGLVPERVTIVDTQGKVMSAAGELDSLNGLSESQVEYRIKIEKHLKVQAETLLAEVLGPGRAAVRVHAEVDFNQKVTEREYYAPVVGKKGLIRSERKNTVTPVKQKVEAGGAAGTASNLQGYPPSGQLGRMSSNKSERTIKYEMNRTVERLTTASGAITRLSVGIFVDGELAPEQLGDIQGVLSQAMGIDAQRGDQIEIKSIKFNREGIEQERQLLEKSQREKFWITLLTKWAPKVMLVLAALVFLGIGIRYMKKNMSALSSRENGERAREADKALTPETILGLLKQNPNESAQILKHWIS